ncbi:hypothetical protein [Actinoplanes sp. NPDC051859]|uniref:hypothetical protein n=1 Tax=Actinoplanes sp. NPDC051859 TaxID=3363909 RepID=UPI0037A8CCE9
MVGAPLVGVFRVAGDGLFLAPRELLRGVLFAGIRVRVGPLLWPTRERLRRERCLPNGRPRRKW